MELTVVAAVLVAAVAHATWNAITHRISDKLAAAVAVQLGGATCSLPFLFLAPIPDPRSWPLLGVSVVLHVAYLLLLMQAYRLGDFSQAYPIARGIAPLLVLGSAALFVGEIPDPLRLAGIVVVSAGLAGIVLFRRGEDRLRDNLPGLAAAAGTGLVIASYTTVDGIAVRASGTALGYTAWLLLFHGLVLPLTLLAFRDRRTFFTALKPALLPGMSAGVLSFAAYGLVLWAQTRGQLGPVAALRESSIIVGALIGTLLFGERFGYHRIAATVVVVVGIVLITSG